MRQDECPLHNTSPKVSYYTVFTSDPEEPELLRRVRAWCPACYEEWKINGKAIYEPLLLSVEAVKICLNHQRYLSFNCPHCNRALPTLAWGSRPGYCSKCYQWLGSDLSKAALSQISDKTDLEWQIWTAEHVGHLLAYSPNLREIPKKNQVSVALSTCITRITEGNIAEFARQLGMPKNTVWLWQSGKVLPKLSLLLKVCYAVGLPLLDFLLFSENHGISSELYVTSQTTKTSSQRSNQRFDGSRIQKHLEAVLVEEPPPSMQMVAQRLGYGTKSLRRRFPDSWTAISARYLNYQECIRTQKIEASCEEVRQTALKLYGVGIDPARSYIAKCLSKPAYFREPRVLAALKAVRQELGLD